MASTQKAKIPVGFVIAGKYRVTGELGRGGMAAVYEAENVDIGKRVAIKILAQELISSTIVVERFLREARAVAAIRSPYICDVYDSGRLDDGRPFLVLELLEGESLYERMVRLGQIEVETTAMVMAQTCRGLTRAHATGIVHRDLKPENIFVTKDEEGELLAKILDFGLAKFYQPVEEGAAPARLTRDGAVFGTPAYMSPEQVRGQGAVDARADLWALGCITYECLTGRTVWSTDQGVAMTFAQIAQGVLPDPVTFRPDLPETFREWFKKALHKDILQRFQTPKEFADELIVAMNLTQHRASENSQDLMFSLRQGEGSLLTPHAGGERSSRAGSRAGTRPSLGGMPSGANLAPTPISHETSPVAPPPGQTKTAESIMPTGKSSAFSKVLLTVGILAVLGAGAYFGYRTIVPPSAATGTTASADADVPLSSASAMASGSASASASALSHDEGLPWRPYVSQAQELIAKGDLDGARAKLKEALDKGNNHHTPQAFASHLDLLKANKTEPKCKLTGLGRPRTYDVYEEKPKRVPANAPWISVGMKGAVLVWTENANGVETAQAVALDEAMRAKTKPFEVTPEGQLIQRPAIYPVGERFLLVYTETKGLEMGVYARYLDADGRIATAQTQISKAPGGASSPTVVMLPDKNYLFTWFEPSDKNRTVDLYARKFTAELEPVGEKIRLTVFAPRLSGRTIARSPFAAVDKEFFHITFRLDRDADRVVQHIRIPFAQLEAPGVKLEGMTPKTPDRILGYTEVLSPPRQRVFEPELVCAPGACTAVWHAEALDGVYAALLKGNAKALFHSEIVKNMGRNPGIGINYKGASQLFWFERGGRIMTGKVDPDLRPVDGSVVGRISLLDRAPPSVSAGLKENEWYATFTDSENNYPEVFAVRVECK